MDKERLVTTNYCFILTANFLLYFGFYLLLPVLPFYLSEIFHAGAGATGIILACYTLAALIIRPFSGFLLDTFARKPLYLFAFFIFTAIFAGYILAGTLTVFILLRVLHGFSFGAVSVAGNTIVIDIMPSSRRGEGLGYYGLANNIAMAVGPMAGLFLHEHYSFNTVFACALVSCILGLLMALAVRTPLKPPVKKVPLSLDRFILIKGLPVGLVLVLLSIPYGMTSAYIAVYGQSIGIKGSAGLFFTLLAIGTATSRVFAGRQVDKGKITQLITVGLYIVCVCFFGLAACALLVAWNATVGNLVFFGLALFFGLGFGSMFPAFNTMFVNLAPHNQRGTATSTYLTSWDVGIGMGLTAGGYIAEACSFQGAYFFGGCLVLLSILLFGKIIAPFYCKNRNKTAIPAVPGNP
ncbi:MAG: MFS transporter [Prevotellaceae bacterium]|jgi:MFS family permease|nr:MFS transporter [Prevotellaceae bacterium]